MDRSGVVAKAQFAYRKGLGTYDALLWVSHTLQTELESGHEARIIQIYFSAAFDRVNHHGILYRNAMMPFSFRCTKPRAITIPPKMSLLLEAKTMPALIIKPRLILVVHMDDLSWYIPSNQQ